MWIKLFKKKNQLAWQMNDSLKDYDNSIIIYRSDRGNVLQILFPEEILNK